MKRFLLLGLLFNAFVVNANTGLGLENLIKKQNENGGFIAPIESSTIMYNTHMMALYSYLGITKEKTNNVSGIIRHLQNEQKNGLRVYPQGPVKPAFYKAALLAYHLAGISQSDKFYQEALIKMDSKTKENDFFITPYLMFFNVAKEPACVSMTGMNWILKRENKLPWIKVVAIPSLYLLATQGKKEISKWPLAVEASKCNKKLDEEKAKKLSKDFVKWFEKYVSHDGTLFDYVPTTIPAIMALHHAKNFIPEDTKKLNNYIQKALATIESFQIQKSDGIQQSAGEGSITETSEMIQLMIESGLTQKDKSLNNAVQFLLKTQAPSGGWGFSQHNIHFPDADGTGLVLTALKMYQDLGFREDVNTSITKALNWLSTRNNPDGGFGTWDKKQDMFWWFGLITKPLSKLGFVFSESLEEATSRVLIGLAPFKTLSPSYDQSWIRGIKWLLTRQNKDGSFPGIWMIGPQFGTASALSALSTALNDKRIDQKKLNEVLLQGITYLKNKQSLTGALGDDPSVYDTGISKESTSPALTGIILSRVMQFNKNSNGKYEKELMPLLLNGRTLLESTMNQEGLWDDESWTAVTFPKIEYSKYSFIQQLESLRVLNYLERL